jgi:hypothetical protein
MIFIAAFSLMIGSYPIAVRLLAYPAHPSTQHQV